MLRLVCVHFLYLFRYVGFGCFLYDCTIFHFHTFTRDIPYTWYRVLFSRSIISNRSATARCVSSSILVLQPSHYHYSLRSGFHYYYFLRFYSPCCLFVLCRPLLVSQLMTSCLILSICARFTVFPCVSTVFLFLWLPYAISPLSLAFMHCGQTVGWIRCAGRLRPWPHCVRWGCGYNFEIGLGRFRL